jgi:hypothetical protein
MKTLVSLIACFLCSSATFAETSEPADPLAERAAQVAQCASRVKYYQDGKPSSCQVSQAFLIGNIQIPSGSDIAIRPNGEVGSAWLGKDSNVYGQALPAGTALHFGERDRLRHFWLPRDTVLQGHLVKGQDDGAGSRLHPNGKLLAIWLAQDEVIDGIPCTSSGNVLRMGFGVIRLGTQRMAWFYDNGRLQQAMLSQDVTLQGHGFKSGEVISLDPDGKVVLNSKKLSEW